MIDVILGILVYIVGGAVGSVGIVQMYLDERKGTFGNSFGLQKTGPMRGREIMLVFLLCLVWPITWGIILIAVLLALIYYGARDLKSFINNRIIKNW